MTGTINIEAFYTDATHTVFIAESIQDLNTLIAAGIESAVVLDPETQGHDLISILDNKPTQKKMIFCPNTKNYENWNVFQKELKERTITESEFLPKRYYMGKTSLSEAEQAAIKDASINPRRRALPIFQDGLTAYKRKQEEMANPKPGNIDDYFKSGKFTEDITCFKKGAAAKTLFDQIDSKIGGYMYAGLYIIGAVPSLGKTTFCLQIADNIASQKQPVLFFSMEQSRLELVTKSIARISRKDNPGSQDRILNSLQIRKGIINKQAQDALEKYQAEIAPYMNIIEGNFDTSPEEIRIEIERFIRRNKQRPVVFIDYLQILRPMKKDKQTDTRGTIDQNLTELKRISRDNSIPIFIVSSLNRDNYKSTGDFEIFKESGGIEYTADVLFSMEYSVIRTFTRKNDETERRDMVNEAKAADPREITFKCLKNRYGIANFEIEFDYYPKYDYFKEKAQPKRKTKNSVII